MYKHKLKLVFIQTENSLKNVISKILMCIKKESAISERNYISQKIDVKYNLQF